MGGGHPQMREARLQIVPQRRHGGRVDAIKARQDHHRGLPAGLVGRRVTDGDEIRFHLGPRGVGHFV